MKRTGGQLVSLRMCSDELRQATNSDYRQVLPVSPAQLHFEDTLSTELKKISVCRDTVTNFSHSTV